MKMDLEIPTMEHHMELKDPKLPKRAWKILRHITKKTNHKGIHTISSIHTDKIQKITYYLGIRIWVTLLKNNAQESKHHVRVVVSLGEEKRILFGKGTYLLSGMYMKMLIRSFIL